MWTKKLQAMVKKVVRMVLMRMMIWLVHLQLMQLGQVVDSCGK
jgi:hypothetical protein